MTLENTDLSRLRAVLIAHRWTVIVAVGVFAVAGIGGALIGLAPFAIGLLALLVVVGASSTLVVSSRRQERQLGSRVGPVLGHFALVGIAAFGVIQLVPYGRDHSNPPVIGEPDWSSPRTRELMVNACYGCHSNEVEYPWYSNIAPISWAIEDHVDDGRNDVNYSEFTVDPGEADETVEVILDGSMPPGYYTAFGLHAEANLSDAERAELVAGLRATPGLSEDGDDDDDDD